MKYKMGDVVSHFFITNLLIVVKHQTTPYVLLNNINPGVLGDELKLYTNEFTETQDLRIGTIHFYKTGNIYYLISSKDNVKTYWVQSHKNFDDYYETLDDKSLYTEEFVDE